MTGRGLALGGVLAAGAAALGPLLLHEPGGGSVAMPHPPARAAPAKFAALLHAADPAAGAALFRSCAGCHTVGRGGADLDGPNLYGVVGSPVAGRRPRYAYTAALRKVGGAWSFDRLDGWLADPAAFAPGTRMGFPGLPEARDRANIIAFLNAQGSDLPLP